MILYYDCVAGVVWLDFFEQLLIAPSADTDAAWKLNPAYRLDGTHLNPSYLHLLEAALSKSTTRK